MKKLVILTTFIVLSTGMAMAADTYESGNWTNTIIWSTGAVPGLDDAANIKYGHSITVDSTQTVGRVYMVGASSLDILAGGDLTIDNSGAENGFLVVDTKDADINVTVSDYGKLRVKTYLKFQAGLAGVTNSFTANFCDVYMDGWTEWGYIGEGKARLHIDKQGSVKMWGKSNLMQANTIVQFTMQTNGTVSALNLMKEDGFITVDPGATLVVDMSEMDVDDVGPLGSEILLINVDKIGGSFNGTFDNIEFFGDTEVTDQYEVTYTANGSNDLNNSVGLVVVPSSTWTAYDAWSNNYALVEGPDGDDDEDGVSNLYEFGVGGNPTNGADTGIDSEYGVNNDGSIDWFEYIYAMQTNENSGLIYYLETTEDLGGTWINDFYEATGTGATATVGFNYVTNRISTEGVSQRFVRLIIEQQ